LTLHFKQNCALSCGINAGFRKYAACVSHSGNKPLMPMIIHEKGSKRTGRERGKSTNRRGGGGTWAGESKFAKQTEVSRTSSRRTRTVVSGIPPDRTEVKRGTLRGGLAVKTRCQVAIDLRGVNARHPSTNGHDLKKRKESGGRSKGRKPREKRLWLRC